MEQGSAKALATARVWSLAWPGLWALLCLPVWEQVSQRVATWWNPALAQAQARSALARAWRLVPGQDPAWSGLALAKASVPVPGSALAKASAPGPAWVRATAQDPALVSGRVWGLASAQASVPGPAWAQATVRDPALVSARVWGWARAQAPAEGSASAVRHLQR